MSKFFHALLFIVLLFLVYSCSNNSLSQKIEECYYPDSPTEVAPLWVCGAKLDDIDVSAVGSFEVNKVSVSFAHQQAIANARVVLAQQIVSDVSSKVSHYAESRKNEDNVVVEVKNVNKLLSEVISNATILGSRMYKESTSPKGVLYVIVGIDQKLYKNFIVDVMKSSYEKQKTTWSKDFSEEEFDSLIKTMN